MLCIATMLDSNISWFNGLILLILSTIFRHILVTSSLVYLCYNVLLLSNIFSNINGRSKEGGGNMCNNTENNLKNNDRSTIMAAYDTERLKITETESTAG